MCIKLHLKNINYKKEKLISAEFLSQMFLDCCCSELLTVNANSVFPTLVLTRPAAAVLKLPLKL